MICNKCHQDKKVEELLSRGGFLLPHCKQCKSIYDEAYRKRNAVRIHERYLKYYSQNAERIGARTRKWAAEHSDQKKQIRIRYRAIHNENEKQRHSERMAKRDTEYQIRVTLRKRMSRLIRKGCKTGSAVVDLGCSVKELIAYLEGLFQPGTSWDNYGRYGWHIDHRKPLASFDLTDPEQFRQAVHYTNLQPLWALDNLKKGDRYVG